MTDHELYERAMDGEYVGDLPYLCGVLCNEIRDLKRELDEANMRLLTIRNSGWNPLNEWPNK